MRIEETIQKVISSIGEIGNNDAQIYEVLEHISSESRKNERLFRDIRDVEIFLDDLRKKYDGGNGGNGGIGNMNLYPSFNKGACQSFCLGIASRLFEEKRDGIKTGFKGLMLNLCAYWFECLSINRTTLILTRSWDSRKFAEYYKEIIDNYTITHRKKVFIIEVDPAGFFLRYPY
jgi:hypothetical protein